MRNISFIVIALLLIVSCRNSDGNRSSVDSLTVYDHSKAKSDNRRRGLIIQELNRLKSVLLSTNKQQIATIFQFPLSDTIVGIYIDDTSYNAEFTKNGNKTTQSMFLQYYPQIYESLQLRELEELFKKIRLEDLQQKDTLELEVKVNTEPCFKFYGIEVNGDMVTLTTGQGVNDTFSSSRASSDEVPENSSEFCESVLWWIFKFNGRKLIFVKQTGAG
jgi:hypothetical protein